MAWHDEETAPSGIHQIDFVDSTDPSGDSTNRVAAYKRWVDTTGGTGKWIAKIRNAANSAWETLTAASIRGVNVSTTAPTDGQVLTYDNATTSWKPATPSGSAAPSAYATLTDGATITWATGGAALPNAKVTLGGNRTLAITGAASGQSGTLIVTQDGTGSRTLTFPAGSTYEGGSLALSTAAGAVDVLAYTYDGTSYYWTIGKAFA